MSFYYLNVLDIAWHNMRNILEEEREKKSNLNSIEALKMKISTTITAEQENM